MVMLTDKTITVIGEATIDEINIALQSNLV